MSERNALQAFEDAYNKYWGWPPSVVDPDHPIQQATLAAIKAAMPHLTAPQADSQLAYIHSQVRLESESDA